MAEYIEREALLKEMLGLHTIPVYIGHVTDEDVMFETMVDVVKEHPTADVVPVVKGHWEERSFIVFDSEIKLGYNCSECNTTWDTPTPYCPNCGAKMNVKGRMRDEQNSRYAL